MSSQQPKHQEALADAARLDSEAGQEPEPKMVDVLWRGQRARAYSEGGVVRVWDDVAGHFTVYHSLTPNQERRVRAKTEGRRA